MLYNILFDQQFWEKGKSFFVKNIAT